MSQIGVVVPDSFQLQFDGHKKSDTTCLRIGLSGYLLKGQLLSEQHYPILSRHFFYLQPHHQYNLHLAFY